MMKYRTLSIAVAAALALCSPLMAESTQSLHVNIAAQSLSSALGEFAKQAKLQLIVDSKLLEGKKAPTLQGDMSLKEALSKLLKGTGLEATIQGDVMVIKPQNDAEVALDAITISAAQATTEGTGSYTTGSTNTATKLNLSLRDTPQSVVVVTHQQIEDQNLESFADVVNSIAGFNAPVWDTDRTYITMRGFEVDYYQIDGMPTYYGGNVQQDLVMYDRVEVVRGANGLMSGAGEPAASINFMRKHATSKEVTGSVTAKAGSWDNYRGTLDVQSGVNESGSVRARVVVSKEDKDSFVDFYHKDTEAFYGIVDADIGDNTLFYAGVSYQNNSADGSSWGGVPAWFSDGTRTDFGASASFTPKWTYWETETKTIFTGVEHTFANDVKLKANYTHLEFESDSKLALTGYYEFPDRTTGLGLNSVYAGKYQTENKQDTIDIYTSIPLELGGLKHEILVGLAYNQEDSVTHTSDPLSSVSTQSVYNWNGNIPEPDWSDFYKTEDTVTKQLGAYLATRIALREDLKLILGSRVSNWEYENKLSDYSYEHDHVVTPYAGVIYDLDEAHSVYASYTDIFKPQDYRDKSGNYLDPKEGASYEAGIKGEYFGGKLNASLAVFRMEQDNVAEADGANFVPGTTTQAYYGAAGVVSKGYEIDLSGSITPEWSVSAGWVHFSAKDAENVDVTTTHPRKEAKLGTTYKMGQLTLGTVLSWQSKFYESTTDSLGNAVDLTQDAVFLVDVMAKYQITKALSAQLNVENLFDKEYYSNIDYSTQVIYGDPRTVTLTMKYTF
jgi:outer-membrane receptor for ferric coprogen and ferric-rhodotorulic acid